MFTIGDKAESPQFDPPLMGSVKLNEVPEQPSAYWIYIYFFNYAVSQLCYFINGNVMDELTIVPEASKSGCPSYLLSKLELLYFSRCDEAIIYVL